jgi:hypothetical protein
MDVNVITTDLKNKTNQLSTLILFPTISSNFINIRYEMSIGKYSIIDMNGKTVLSGNSIDKKLHISVSELAAGLYFFKREGSIGMKKFIKQ